MIIFAENLWSKHTAMDMTKADVEKKLTAGGQDFVSNAYISAVSS